MRTGAFARLVCPDDATDMILYGRREDVPGHLAEDVARLEVGAERLGDFVVTECGHLFAGPALLAEQGRELGEWVWVSVEGGWMAERAERVLATVMEMAMPRVGGCKQPGQVSGVKEESPWYERATWVRGQGWELTS